MSTADLSFIRGKRLRWGVLLVLASLPLVGWWAYGLFDLDEGFYAAVTGSMIRHGEWITPLYNGHPWFEKPILIYWLAKPAILLFGQALGPRLPSVLATIGTYAAVAWFARRRMGAMAAVLSMFILGSSLVVVIVGRMMMTDPLLLFFLTAAMLAYWESVVRDPRWKLVTAACLGFAVLAKGPVAIILFLLIAGWNVWAIKRPTNRQPLSALMWLVGTLILFAVVATWYVPAYLANGQTFVREFLIKQNIGRFEGGDAAHTLPLWKSFWFYIPILLIGMFPWILWLPRAIKSGLSEAPALTRYLLVWASIVFLFFTIAGAKLPHYILPACPPIAILVARHLSEKWNVLDRDAIRPKLFLTVAWLIVTWTIAQIGFEVWYVKSGEAEAQALAIWLKSENTQKLPVIEYQLPRRTKDLGTGKPELQETSLPSLSFYLDQDVLETDYLADVASEAQPGWLVTRTGRIPSGVYSDLKPAKWTKHFIVYAVSPP